MTGYFQSSAELARGCDVTEVVLVEAQFKAFFGFYWKM